MLPLLLSLAASSPPATSTLRAAQEPQAQGALERATAEARELWKRLCAASGSASREPIGAFQLKAEVLTRSGVQTNETRIDYRYLAPDCIRFVLPTRSETGRSGPAQEQYWLKDGDQLVVLAGREYKEDRRHVDDMVTLARNYVALSNPARLQLTALERMSTAPPDLGSPLAKLTGKLAWLALESPDFALVRREGAGATGTVYRVEIGLRGEDSLPGAVVIRERGKGAADPLFVVFSDYRERDGFRIPFQIRVHVLDRSLSTPVFAEKASQEVYVTEALLRPELTVEDFEPKKKE